MNYNFSVVMSVYKNDNADFFRHALESITKNQTLPPDEIVLVVDGPVSNEINTVIDEYSSIYGIFNVIRLQDNGGLGNALRLAVEAARNELIARMDSDDVSLPGRFERQITAFRDDPELGIVGGDVSEFIGEESNIVAYRKVPIADANIKEYMKKRCPFNHMSVMYKKHAVQMAGGYLDLFWNEDYYLWIRMAEHGCKMGNTGTVLVNVRTGADMYRRRGGKKYFESELFLQRLMLDNHMTSRSVYLWNVLIRFILQRLLPNKLRGWVFRNFARER